MDGQQNTTMESFEWIKIIQKKVFWDNEIQLFSPTLSNT